MTDTANLEDGFYWVRQINNWSIARVSVGAVFLHGTGESWIIQDFDEIDPRPIKREDVK